MADLGKAYVQIVPSAEGISGSIKNVLNGEATSAGTAAGENIAGKLVSVLKTAVVAAGIGKFIGDAISAGADLEQSIGGIETLFGAGGQSVEEYAAQVGKSVSEVKTEYAALMDAQTLALENADKAYATAGLSANDYMQTITGFAAALKQSTASEKEAAEVGNQAVIDMADNANKMGTDMQSIQNAYQGFAKQNYTMLDNLKLGYGGTKTEMERLLADASELSGVEYDISNLSDVYNAIHVIQEEMGITGTTAKEAAGTYSGSLNMLKASWGNVMAALGNGNGIETAMSGLGESLGYYASNLVRMLGNIASQLPAAISSLVQTVAPMLIAKAQEIILNLQTQLPVMMQSLMTTLQTLIPQLMTGMQAAIPQIVTVAQSLITNFCTFLTTQLPTLLQEGVTMVNGIVTGILNGLPQILATAAQMVTQLFTGIMNALPTILNAGLQIVTNFATGILNNLPQLISTAGEMFSQFVAAIMTNLPQLMENGAEAIRQLVAGIRANLPEIIASAAEVIAQMVATIVTHLPEILQTGIELIGELIAGIIQAIPDIIAAIPQVISSITDAFGQFDWASIGADILNGIKNGILGAVDSVVSAAKGAGEAIYNGIKGFFNIGSPSKLMRDEIGKMIDEGWAIGIEKNTDTVTKATEKTSKEVKKTAVDGAIEITDAMLEALDIGDEMSAQIANNYKAMYAEMSDTDALKAAQKDVVNFALSLYEASGDAADVADESKTTSEKVQEALEGAKKAYEELESSIESSIESSMSYFDKWEKSKDKIEMKDVLSNMASQIKGVTDYVNSFSQLAAKGVSQPLMEYIQSLGTDGQQYIDAFLSATAEQIQQANLLFATELAMPQAAKTQIMGSYMQAATGAATAFNTEMGLQTANMVMTATESANTLSNAMSAAFANTTSAESAVAAGKEAVQAVSNGVQTNQAIANTQVTTFSNGLTSTMAAELTGDKTYQIGRDFAAGLAQGIQSGSSLVTDAVKAMCDAAVETAKNTLKIGSPSKIMANTVGKWIPAGVASGIMNHIDYVANAMQTMAQTIIADAQSINMKALPDRVGSMSNLDASSFGYTGNGGYTQNVTINAPTQLSPSEIARQTRNSTRDMVLALRGV